MRLYIPRITLYCLFAILASCASSPKLDLPSTDNQSLNQWQAQGKIGFRSTEGAESANFVWENDAQNYQIQLFGPFGMGRVYIQKSGRVVQLKHDGITHTAGSAQQLLEQTTGLSMPVNWLSYWIKGLPAPNTKFSAIELNEQSHLTRFEQGGWLVAYSRYSAVNQYTLPSKMRFSKDDYSVTVVIKSWGT